MSPGRHASFRITTAWREATFFDDVLPRQINDAYLVVGGSSAEFFYRYFEWQHSHFNIVAFIVPVKNGNAFLYGVPVVPLSHMSSLLSKTTAVYVLPDCPEPARDSVMRLCGPYHIPVRALELSVQTLGTEELHQAAIAG